MGNESECSMQDLAYFWVKNMAEIVRLLCYHGVPNAATVCYGRVNSKLTNYADSCVDHNGALLWFVSYGVCQPESEHETIRHLFPVRTPAVSRETAYQPVAFGLFLFLFPVMMLAPSQQRYEFILYNIRLFAFS